MRFRIALSALLLALGSVACQTNGDGDTDANVDADVNVDENEFQLTGTVIDVEEGATPSDFEEGAASPEATADAEMTDHAEMTDDAASVDVAGGIALRPDDPAAVENLDDCETVQDAYVTFYTDDTEGDLAENENFPDNLVGQRVTLEGSKEEDADCLLIVETVDEAPALDVDADVDADVDTGGGPAGTAAPDDTPAPTFTEDVFPKHEDTDPIFEGTPDPDECEGQKACNDEPGIGQPDDGGGN
jgi:hypothetical protein